MRLFVLVVPAFLLSRSPSVLAADEATLLQDAIRVHLVSPACSQDCRRVAMVSLNPGDEPAASGSLVILDTSGQLLRRVPLFSSQAHPSRARAALAQASRLLAEGGFKRMPRVRRTSMRQTIRQGPQDPPPSFTGTFSHAEYGFTITVTQGTLRVDAVRGARKLSSATFRMGEEPSCESVASYSVRLSGIGFDPERRVLAFSILAEDGRRVACFSHEFVIGLK